MSQPRFSIDNVDVLAIDAYYDKDTETQTAETPNLLSYESQHFRCKARLQLTEGFTENDWSIGLVQACDRMYLENKYGASGSSYWEFHPLKSRRHTVVNDSDGRQYPFYSLTSSKCEIKKGLVRDNVVNLHFEDHFYPTVAWELPHCSKSGLTDIIRKQDFWIWLVAIKRGQRRSNVYSYNTYNIDEDDVFVLNTLRWKYNLHLTFDSTRAYGRRLKNVYDQQKEQPYCCNTPKPVPISALNPPHCNSAQSLIWYPTNVNERPRILVPPKQIIVPWEDWLADMMPGKAIKAPYPRDCKVVGTWQKDGEIPLLSGSGSSFSRQSGNRAPNLTEKTRLTSLPPRFRRSSKGQM